MSWSLNVLAQVPEVTADASGTPFSGLAQNLVNGVYYLALVLVAGVAVIGIVKGAIANKQGFADSAARAWITAISAVVGVVLLVGLNAILGWAEGLSAAIG